MPLSASAATITITIKNNLYTPAIAQAAPGDTVTWINQDSVAHTVTQDDGAFDSGSIAPGQSYSIKVSLEKTHTYHCDFHTGMKGTLIVGSAATASLTTSTDAITAQVQSLLSQITALQAQLGISTTATTPVTTGTSATTPAVGGCPLVGRALKKGSSGDDVLRLQAFLAKDSSIYPEAQLTGYYGALTEAAVKRWQTKYNIVSSGTAETTGFGVVGPRTAAAIALQCSQSGGSTGTGTGSSNVGGFIEVTPVSGNAPLQVSVKATVNSVLSCAGGTYTLEWGDGTVPQTIQVAQGNCNQVQQTYAHTYYYGGTYIVRLSAGAHSTTATVVVSGQSQPSASASLNVSASPSVLQRGQALSVSWNSQNAPAGSKIRLTLVPSTSAGSTSNNDNGLTPGALATAGSYSWTVPSASAACSADSGTVSCVQPGSYKIFAILYSGNECWGFCQGGSRTIHATASSGTFTISESSADLGPLQISGSVGNNPLAVRATFEMLCGTTATVNWGDGRNDGTTLDCAQGTSGTKSVRSVDHTYAATGAYTITVSRGNRVDSAALVISN